MNTVPRPLAVTADLRLAVDGHDVRITGEARRLVVDLPSLRAGAVLLRSGPFRIRRAARLAGLNRALRAAGLTAEVRVAGAPFARLGLEARPGGLARLLRLGDLEMRPARSLRRLLRPYLWGAAVVGLPLLAGLAVLGRYLNRKDDHA